MDFNLGRYISAQLQASTQELFLLLFCLLTRLTDKIIAIEQV